ncbi:hypothetical protein IWW57_005165, partial [Coemansia sp. S610]
ALAWCWLCLHRRHSPRRLTTPIIQAGTGLSTYTPTSAAYRPTIGIGPLARPTAKTGTGQSQSSSLSSRRSSTERH